MRTLIMSAVSLAAALAVSGCATHDTSKSDSAQSLATTSRSDVDQTSEQSARNAYSWGDKYTAANLFLQAEVADPSIKNRFNLATAYESIGRTGEASDLYRALVVDGQYTRLSEDERQGDSRETQSVNIGHESQKRLLVLASRAPGPTGSTGEVGTGETNEQARVLDQRAEDARGRPVSVN